MEQLEFNLSLTPEARLRQFAEWAELMEALRGRRTPGAVCGRGELLIRLVERGVPFVIVGDMAAALHGATAVTQNLEICASLADGGAGEIVEAFESFNPRWRAQGGAPAWRDDADRRSGSGSMLLRTDRGQIDVVGAVAGMGGIDEVMGRSVELELGGATCRVLGLEAIIKAKRAGGREVDGAALVELKAIRRKRRRYGRR